MTDNESTPKKRPQAKKKTATPAKKAAKKKVAAKKKMISRRLDIMEENNPQMGLPGFVKRVNQLVEKFVPEADAGDGRVTAEFNERTVRHYQAKGIIDAPAKEGKEARYEYRHVLQAVLLRRLLADGLPVKRITRLMEDKPNEIYRDLIVKGVEVSVGPGMKDGPQASADPAVVAGPWMRHTIAPGLEIQVARGFQPPQTEEETKALMRKMRQTMTTVIERRQARANKK